MDDREIIINEIVSYIKSAKIIETSDADFSLKSKEEEGDFPSFHSILKNALSPHNIDKFLERIEKALIEFEKYFDQPKDIPLKVGIKPLETRLKVSTDIISKLLEKVKVKIEFSKLEEPTIKLKIIPTFEQQLIEPTHRLIKELKELLLKLEHFIHSNNFYGDAYRITPEGFNATYKEDERLDILGKKIDKLVASNKKVYSIDYFSDGADEIREMLKHYWDGFSTLLHVVVPKKEKEYLVNDEVYGKEILTWANSVLVKFYRDLDQLLVSPSLFEPFTDSQLRVMEEDILKIEIPILVRLTSEPIDASFGRGERELAKLIGLNVIKENIKKIKAYVKMNKDNSGLNLHMCFYGNPGTGKTEVARIMAQILYENKVLPTNQVIETDRSGLVGQYVGETPYITLEMIESAMGGVLFIDEAYSLVPERFPGDYGHEAVATLIKAMEDQRGKFCVILAGYRSPMEKMIASNPGFKSRIQFELDFPNYSREELGKITQLMVEKNNYLLTHDVLNKILDITDVKRKNPNFSNAREVRNIIDQVIMCQNLRSNDPNNRLILIEDVNKYILDSKLNLPTREGKASKILTGEEELENLIGLETIKLTIKKIRAYAKKNKDTDKLNLHMCFNGNPGTGKTEVARIISRILFDAGVLEEAKVVETDANGLIGKYVGETGPKTAQKVQDAMGGVLFIDEAYALANGKNGTSGDFGQEAIATLIKNMEDFRGKFCVILAGYKEPMKHLLATNPGFDSRIQFSLDFPDYSKEELSRIALKMTAKVHYILDSKAHLKILDILEYQRHNSNFANARSLRNVLDQVIMNQNLRTEDFVDDHRILLEDVEIYVKDQGLPLFKQEKGTTNSPLLNEIIHEIENINTLKCEPSLITPSHIEQAVIAISGDGGEGTGFFISPTGLGLTCAHCIVGNGESQVARIIFLTAEGQMVKNYQKFIVVDKDEINDIAILKITEPGMIFKYLPVAKVEETLYAPFQEFFMAGYPFGGENFQRISFTEGKVASVNYYDNRKVVFADMFGKPGNSGSPIIDKNTKQVMGIFWGGITIENEMIKCFTPIDLIWYFLNKQKTRGK